MQILGYILIIFAVNQGKVGLAVGVTKKLESKFNAVEIMTGGIIPKGYDTIVPIEQIIFYPNKKKPKYLLILFLSIL